MNTNLTTLRQRKPQKTARQKNTTLTKTGSIENEKRIISSIDRGHNDRPSNHCGGIDMIGYNTGKMVIGKYYQKPQKACNDDLNVFWQDVLLRRKKSLLERFRVFCGGEL